MTPFGSVDSIEFVHRVIRSERGPERFSVPGSPKSGLCSLGWRLGVASRRICICLSQPFREDTILRIRLAPLGPQNHLNTLKHAVEAGDLALQVAHACLGDL